MAHRVFEGRVAIVTGASSGIGRATALALARAGARVALAARNDAALVAVARDVESLGGEALVAPTDVSSEAHVTRLVEATLARWGRVDILVASAGAYLRGSALDATVADVERAMDVNLYGALRPVVAVLPHMMARRSGHLVLISSVDGRKALPGDLPYVTSKFALAGLGDALRTDLRGTGVEVTTVFPGRVATPMIDDLHVPWISGKIPPEAVARAIVRAIRRRKAEVVIPFSGRALIWASVLSPRLADWAVHWLGLEGRPETPPAGSP